MTGVAAPPHPAVRVLAGQYRQLRTAHPVRVLRWLRNGMLLGVAAAALLYVWVVIQAGDDINAARRTVQGITNTEKASRAVQTAGTALQRAFETEDPTLTGIGNGYFTAVTQVHKYLILAAEDNAAGTEGTSEIQFAQVQLETYLEQSANAGRDYVIGPRLGLADLTYAQSGESDLLSALTNLQGTERAALHAQRDAWPLDPGTFWWVLLGPVIVMLLLAGATARVLARHFRRHPSRWLPGSLLATAVTMITVGFFNWNDEQELARDQWAGHPVTLAAALLVLLAAAVMADRAYRPRLAEYRFKPS